MAKRLALVAVFPFLAILFMLELLVLVIAALPYWLITGEELSTERFLSFGLADKFERWYCS